MTTRTQPLPRTPAPFADDDPRAHFARAIALGGAVIAAVRPDQLDDPTPCTEFTVRDLLGHLVDGLERVAALGRGDDPFAIDLTSGVADDAWVDTWLAAAHEVQAAWTDDAVLDRTMVLPWETAPGRDILIGYVSEVSVHTWDLARATGQEPAWDDEILERADAATRRGRTTEEHAAHVAAVLEEIRRSAPDMPAPFAPAVEVPADAPPIDRLVAWNGRRPDWSR